MIQRTRLVRTNMPRSTIGKVITRMSASCASFPVRREQALPYVHCE